MKQNVAANNYPLVVPEGFRPKESRLYKVFNATDSTKSIYAIIGTDGKVIVYNNMSANHSYFITGNYII